MSEESLQLIMDELKHIKQTMATKDDVAEIPFIKAAVQDLSGKVDDLAGKVDDLTGRVDDLTGRVDDLTGKVGIIEREMVRKTDLEYIHHKIAEHDREIFDLKNR